MNVPIPKDELDQWRQALREALCPTDNLSQEQAAQVQEDRAQVMAWINMRIHNFLSK